MSTLPRSRFQPLPASQFMKQSWAAKEKKKNHAGGRACHIYITQCCRQHLSEAVREQVSEPKPIYLCQHSAALRLIGPTEDIRGVWDPPGLGLPGFWHLHTTTVNTFWAVSSAGCTRQPWNRTSPGLHPAAGSGL